MMHVKEITYSMKRTTEQFENDTVTVTLAKDEDIGEAIRTVKGLCRRALHGYESDAVAYERRLELD